MIMIMTIKAMTVLKVHLGLHSDACHPHKALKNKTIDQIMPHHSALADCGQTNWSKPKHDMMMLLLIQIEKGFNFNKNPAMVPYMGPLCPQALYL